MENANVDNSAGRRRGATVLPPVDVVEDATGITLWADMPGVPREKLALHLETDTLTIEGEVMQSAREGAGSAEAGAPRYRRAFTLSRELDTAKAAAEFANGVLKLHIPKAEHAQPRRIPVQVN